MKFHVANMDPLDIMELERLRADANEALYRLDTCIAILRRKYGSEEEGVAAVHLNPPRVFIEFSEGGESICP